MASSGREMVRFNAPFEPGHIVVSFGDRRLYFVNAPGEAISYPIAIPREEDRWEGATTVTNKRVNPSWTPTPTMVAENPSLAALGAGWTPVEPTRRARALSGLQYLPNPRHGCALDNWHGCLEGLHPHV